MLFPQRLCRVFQSIKTRAFLASSLTQYWRLIYLRQYSFEHTQARGRIHVSNPDAAKHLRGLTNLIDTKVVHRKQTRGVSGTSEK